MEGASVAATGMKDLYAGTSEHSENVTIRQLCSTGTQILHSASFRPGRAWTAFRSFRMTIFFCGTGIHSSNAISFWYRDRVVFTDVGISGIASGKNLVLQKLRPEKTVSSCIARRSFQRRRDSPAIASAKAGFVVAGTSEHSENVTIRQLCSTGTQILHSATFRPGRAWTAFRLLPMTDC